ncbi:hypothetical protein AVEN_138762-1 [Araneus ventricosus]|uniref:Uncharacterized protein n=1 Tax=Araneus ventricosus TaxID=182803 RepID=A0A4Y2FLR2_ARAVE|nr:hypothetical protein AVEN_138762-1 [Araneus ventricosus]
MMRVHLQCRHANSMMMRTPLRKSFIQTYSASGVILRSSIHEMLASKLNDIVFDYSTTSATNSQTPDFCENSVLSSSHKTSSTEGRRHLRF